jgi:hypothetical protein
MSITFVTAANSEEVLRSNLLVSPALLNRDDLEVLIQRDFPSASKAYNDAIDRASNDLIVFAHQDMIFPQSWLGDLSKAMARLEEIDPHWGVLGCFGETLDHGGRGFVYSPYQGILGQPAESPEPVQTLDEIVLIVRKSSGLRFDPGLPHFHFYGADICMAAADSGMKSYAISALCVHNSHQNFVLPDEFYDSYKHFKKRWNKFLPIQTTCARVTRFDFRTNQRKLLEFYLRNIRRKRSGAVRMKDGLSALHQLARLHPEFVRAESGEGRYVCQ